MDLATIFIYQTVNKVVLRMIPHFASANLKTNKFSEHNKATRMVKIPSDGFIKIGERCNYNWLYSLLASKHGQAFFTSGRSL